MSTAGSCLPWPPGRGRRTARTGRGSRTGCRRHAGVGGARVTGPPQRQPWDPGQGHRMTASGRRWPGGRSSSTPSRQWRRIPPGGASGWLAARPGRRPLRPPRGDRQPLRHEARNGVRS